jgi:glycosyltransferase involved in cell wall biosynthesis
MPVPQVSLIITTYQMPNHLRKVLASVARQTAWEQLEIIVSDDGSTDETAQVVQEFSQAMGKPIGFVTQPHKGFHLTRCRNNGARIASAPYLLFLDGDCLIPPDHVEQYVLRRKRGVVQFGYCIRLDQGTSERIHLPQIANGDFMRWASPEQLHSLRTLHFKSLFYQFIRHPTKPVLKGGNVGILREDYERLNGYDEQFRAWGCEDDDLSHRARQAGLNIRSMLGATRTYHLWHPPAASKPSEKWSDGENVAYFQRRGRLTACMHGLRKRNWSEVTFALRGKSPWSSSVHATLSSQFRAVAPEETAEIDVLCDAHSRFHTTAACRVLIAPSHQLGSLGQRNNADLILPLDADPITEIQQFLLGTPLPSFRPLPLSA